MPNLRPNYIPDAKEWCAVSPPTLWKRDALLFDRLYLARDTPDQPDIIPDSITFGCAEIDLGIKRLGWRDLAGAAAYGATQEMIEEWQNNLIAENEQLLIAQSYNYGGIRATPSYQCFQHFVSHFPWGNERVFLATLLNLPLPNPSATSWAQILEFRSDTAARRAYRGLSDWVECALRAESVAEVTELINHKLSTYRSALKKHGLQIVSGAFTYVIDARLAFTFSGRGSPGQSGDAIWTVLASGVTVQDLSATIVEGHLKVVGYHLGIPNEIAFIYDRPQ